MTTQPRRGFLRDNALTLAFLLLLAGSLVGQAISGTAGYNAEARVGGFQEISLARYVTSSSFAVDVSENWQSEYLQFSVLILLTIWFIQRGSSESKRPGEEGRETDEEQLLGKHTRPDSPAWARAGGWRTRVYSHSLLTAMTAVFVVSWAAQAVTGRVADNEARMRDLLEPLSLGSYLATPDFWTRTFQNWQSEMLAVATMAIFAVYLRERGSPESKQVGMPHYETVSDD
jgi:membrane protein implicated in regulation of membrane protease activity